MRIIRGCQKGRKILPPKNFNSRPTTDFAKESLFNILENKYNLENLKVLDLFSGTGNISLEFLSRGSKEVTSVEIRKKNCLHIKTQINSLFTGKGNVIISDVYKFCEKTTHEVDLIFADPPFEDKKIHKLPELIFNNEALQKAVFILEHSAKNDFSTNKYFEERRKYGNINFTFFIKKK